MATSSCYSIVKSNITFSSCILRRTSLTTLGEPLILCIKITFIFFCIYTSRSLIYLIIYSLLPPEVQLKNGDFILVYHSIQTHITWNMKQSRSSIKNNLRVFYCLYLLQHIDLQTMGIPLFIHIFALYLLFPLSGVYFFSFFNCKLTLMIRCNCHWKVANLQRIWALFYFYFYRKLC